MWKPIDDGERCSSAGAVLAGVEPFGSEGVGDHGSVVHGAVDSLGVASGERSGDEVSAGGHGGVDVESSGASASLESADRRSVGSSRPRASARRRIPTAARGLKKNLGWTWASKTSDNEDATASLGHSEVLSVEDPPDGASPRSGNHTCARPSSGGNSDIGAHEGAQDRCEVQACVGGQSPRHVLPERPFDPEGEPDPLVVPVEAGAFPVEAGAPSGDTEVLAGGASDEEVGGGELGGVEGLEVGPDGDPGETGGEEPLPPRIELAERDGSVPGSFQAEVESSGPGANRDNSHWSSFRLGTCRRVVAGQEVFRPRAEQPRRVVDPWRQLLYRHDNRAGLVAHREVIITVRDRVAKQISEGKTVEQIVASKPTADLDQKVGLASTSADRFVQQLYAELRAGR